MVYQVSDTPSNRRDQIANFAELLRNSPTSQRVFSAVYRGKKRTKSADELTFAVGMPTRKRLTEVAKGMVDEKFFEQGREQVNGRSQTVYTKIPFIARNKEKILQLARSKAKLDNYETKTNAKTKASGIQRIVIKVPFKFKGPQFIHVDDIDQFSKVKAVKSIPDALNPTRLPENRFKAGILQLLSETKTPKDWGGETNDIFTTRINVKGTKLRGAFALKGPAKSGPLTPGMMGKRGDQIQRLFRSPAQVFFVQYEGEITEEVIDTMDKLAISRAILGQEIFFGVIDREDSYRLRLAYPNAFR